MSESRPLAVIACGALAAPLRRAAAGAGRPVEVHPLSALLHDRPAEIAPAAEALARRLLAEGKEVALAYADCGSYGALDALCGSLGLRRLPGLHCYDVMAGPEQVAALLAEAAGTYLLTDFLVESFGRTVVAELGLDSHPELVADYFGHYERVVWLTESDEVALEERARAIASRLGLAFEKVVVGSERLEGALAGLWRGER